MAWAEGRSGKAVGPIVVAYLWALASCLVLTAVVQLIVYIAAQHAEFGHLLLYFLLPSTLSFSVLMCYLQLMKGRLEGWKAYLAGTAAMLGSYLFFFAMYYVATEPLGLYSESATPYWSIFEK